VNSSTDIRVPRETVNDDVVKITAWHVAPGTKVRAKDVVVSIETSKAVLEVEADADGYVHILHAAGAEVAVGALIGTINGSPQPAGAATSSSRAPGPANLQPGNGSSSGGGATISKKAQAIMAEHNIDASAFAGRGLVREADVLAYLQSRAAAQADASIEVQEKVVANPHVAKPQAAKRGLLHDARVSAGDRGTNVFVLGLNYLWRNWFLGNLVRWAPRGIILPLHRLRGVKMGRDCFIDPTAIVETAFPENVTLGNDVRITAGVVIMTHIKAPHYLRDTGIMPVVLKPVVLEDHCFIGVNSVIMPGVTVGKASVVASGSVVTTNVPPFTMVGGNPAKIIRKFERPAAEGAAT
jgi:acetyltransferase-like isoleucine patch superfamily enzyme